MDFSPLQILFLLLLLLTLWRSASKWCWAFTFWLYKRLPKVAIFCSNTVWLFYCGIKTDLLRFEVCLDQGSCEERKSLITCRQFTLTKVYLARVRGRPI